MLTQVCLCPCGFGFICRSFGASASRRDIYDEANISSERSPLTSSWNTCGMGRRNNIPSPRG